MIILIIMYTKRLLRVIIPTKPMYVERVTDYQLSIPMRNTNELSDNEPFFDVYRFKEKIFIYQS